MNIRKALNLVRRRRTRRVTAPLRGTAGTPRLAVFRSNRSFSAQLIDDDAGRTLVGVSLKHLGKKQGTKTELAGALGELIAEKAKGAGIAKAIFDRRRYAYHGRVKAFAEGARKGGMQF